MGAAFTQARDAIVKLFADAGVIRGSDLQAYVDGCVAKLKQPKFRFEFQNLVRRLIALFDALMPRPEARPFTTDVKIYAFIGKVAANLYRDESLDVRGVARKVQSILNAYIKAHGIDPKIPPITILDPSFAAEVSRQTSDRAKAAEMENALRHHISVFFEKDPARFTRLSDRLDAILSSHRDDWSQIAARLQALVEEASSGASEYRYQGLSPYTEGPIFGILRTKYAGNDKDIALAELAVEIVSHVREQTAVAGFWANSVAQEEARRWVFRTLDDSNIFHFSEIDEIASRCMAVARENRASFDDE